MNNQTETPAQDLSLDDLDQVAGGGSPNGHSTGALRNVSGDNSLIDRKGALQSLAGTNTYSGETVVRGIIAI